MEVKARLSEVTEEGNLEVEEGECSQLDMPEIRKVVMDGSVFEEISHVFSWSNKS